MKRLYFQNDGDFNRVAIVLATYNKRSRLCMYSPLIDSDNGKV